MLRWYVLKRYSTSLRLNCSVTHRIQLFLLSGSNLSLLSQNFLHSKQKLFTDFLPELFNSRIRFPSRVHLIRLTLLPKSVNYEGYLHRTYLYASLTSSLIHLSELYWFLRLFQALRMEIRNCLIWRLFSPVQPSWLRGLFLLAACWDLESSLVPSLVRLLVCSIMRISHMVRGHFSLPLPLIKVQTFCWKCRLHLLNSHSSLFIWSPSSVSSIPISSLLVLRFVSKTNVSIWGQ